MKSVTLTQGNNYAEISFSNVLKIWTSYNTVIAFMTPRTGRVCRENDWGPTTGKHLNAVEADKSKRISGADFEARLAEVLKGFGLSD